MNGYVGLDIGAVSITAALLVDRAGAGDPAGGAFRRAGQASLPGSHVGEAPLFVSAYRRTRGRPIEAATAVLDEVVATVGAEAVKAIRVTGSAGGLVAEKLAAETINEFKALALGASALGLAVRTLFEMGGQSSKYLLLEPGADGCHITDYATNGDCAAGTGSFIDQQAGRLRIAVEEVGPVAIETARTAQIAGRCSVFAKSDMIHAQQKGYTPAEVLRGLCEAVARNYRMAVVRSHPVVPPVAFVGGLAANAAVARAVRDVFELPDDAFVVPAHHAHLPAIGAAAAAGAGAAETAKPRRAYSLARHVGRLRTASDARRGGFPSAEPLSMHRVVCLRDQVAPAPAAEAGLGFTAQPVDAYLGIDVGSVSTNLALTDADGNVIKEIYTRTQGRPIEVVGAALKDIADAAGGRVTIRGVGTTGSGRELIGELVGADTINDEITAHKTGATFIGQKMLAGRVPDTIFEIGGQDSKFISLQDGVVVDFTMNEACAAGTGSFLEERAEELDIAIINEFAELALSSAAPIRLGERCTVFMERDVNDYLQRGASKADLVAGLAYSVVLNYINRVVRGRHIGECIFFQGGTAYNDAVAAAFAAVLGKEIIVPPHNGVIGAIGAALLAREQMRRGGGHPDGQYVATRGGGDRPASRFRGYDLGKVHYGLREFTCQGCSNRCIIQEFDVEGEKTYWGDKCSDRYRKRRKSIVAPVIEDLFALRERLLADEASLPAAPASAPTVGIPRAMFALDTLPFWRTFWRRCGFNVAVSDPTNRRIAAAGARYAVAEPCFPVIVAHGHLAELIDAGVDWLFVPNMISAETRWTSQESFVCPWGQTLPFVLRRAPAFEPHLERFLTPRVTFRMGHAAVGKELRGLGRRLGIARRTLNAALSAAYDAQERFRQALLDAGRRATDALDRAGAAGIVITGRPYNVHDAGVSLSVPRKLRDHYGVNCIPIDCLDTDAVDIRDLHDNMYWEYGRRIIAAARIVAGRANLHIIHITNFKCGPDSFIKHFIRVAGGKPFLSLQFDGHSNDAGMMTRCEAYLDSKGILRPWKGASSAEDAAVLTG